MSDINNTILELVQRHYPHLAEPALQEEIARHGRLMRYSAGSIIMDYGAFVRMVPMMVEGRIKVVREDEEGNELFLYYLQSGDSCAMSFTCCMMHKKSEVRTVAEEDAIFIGIPIQYVDSWMTKYQSWKNFVMRTYDERMKELIYTIDSIAFKKMDERLVDYLEQKASAADSKIVQATHQEIAADLNASREAVSRLLKQLEKKGHIRLGRNKIELLN